MPVTSPRGYVAGNFLLRLDGADAGFVKSIDGGAISADVIHEPAGNSYFVRKHIGAPKYEDFTIQIGWWMTKTIYDWIRASWTMNYQRKNGSIVSYDFNLEARSEREFFNALVTEVTIPAMDAGSKDQCYLTVKFTPELIRAKKAAGKATLPPVKAAQEMWLPSNFRLEIGGLDCTKVSAIDAFTVRQKAVPDNIGNARDYQKEPGRLEFPNLSITMAETAAATWLDWFEDFVVKGNNDETREKTGSLVFLSPNLQAELGRISFFNLGIFKIAPAKADAADERIQRVTAQLYCERMELQAGKIA
jgi:phage tail-like protein